MATEEAQREYQRKWKARRRAEWFSDKSCVKCGSTDRMEIDHIDPATKVHHQVWTWAKQRRDAELKKCQVLCHKHHLEKTKVDMKKMDPNAHLRRIDPPGTAWCTMHQDFLPIKDFTNNRTKRRGLETECKGCRKKMREKSRIARKADTVSCGGL